MKELLAAIGEGRVERLYLVAGDRVLAEPAASRLGEALAAQAGCDVEVHRRPASLAPLFDDLRTFSLFAPAKVLVAVETAVLADRAAAAGLIDEAREVLPLAGAGELSGRERQAASRLLRTLALFGLDPRAGTATAVIGKLPAWALQGGGRGRGKASRARVEERREQLAELLEAARASRLEGFSGSELAALAEIAEGGLPDNHALVLAESAVARDHPLVKTLAGRGALVEVGRVEAKRGGAWGGLEPLAAELERESGVAIRPDALDELARRTLQQRGGRGAAAAADSSARFAAEYRKLATLARPGEIDLGLVETGVADRGQEDVWKILDAIGEGRGAEALDRLRRLLAAAADPVAARLSFFALLAGFVRLLTAVGGMLAVSGAPRGVGHYGRFKSQVAPALQAELEGGAGNPLAGVHPFRLHRAYLAACRWPPAKLAGLPGRVLETELRLKGESGRPMAALATLVADLASAGRQG